MIAQINPHPHRVVLAISVFCWAWMLSGTANGQRLSCCGRDSSRFGDFVSWMGMVGAMMLPTTIWAVQDVAIRSYHDRRMRAIVGYIFGYVICWIFIGVVFVIFRLWPIAHDVRTAVFFCLISAAWSLLPCRNLWFMHCHRQIPLCPSGPRADFDVLRQGLIHGRPCINACWPLMFACGISGHDFIVMICGAILAITEKRMFRFSGAPAAVCSWALAGWLLIKFATAE
jgi:hypothetical protein